MYLKSSLYTEWFKCLSQLVKNKLYTIHQSQFYFENSKIESEPSRTKDSGLKEISKLKLLTLYTNLSKNYNFDLSHFNSSQHQPKHLLQYYSIINNVISRSNWLQRILWFHQQTCNIFTDYKKRINQTLWRGLFNPAITCLNTLIV